MRGVHPADKIPTITKGEWQNFERRKIVSLFVRIDNLCVDP